ncbi:MAG: S8 family serine peptidase, partial [Bacteroidia bacterium]|nr:S8 family serine peptidase [Bacteroidia bacterium]
MIIINLLWFYNGTSFSSPIVASSVGLILSVNQCLMPEDVQYIIKATADPIADASLYPGMVGAGRLNLFQAVLMAQNYGTIAPILNYTEWNTEIYVKGNLVIEQGGILKIFSKVRMSEESKIIIKSGGKLIIDGGFLTNSNGCHNLLWQGIEVQCQYAPNPGIVELYNGAVIENALTGITVNGGAIVRAEDCTLKNNITAVKFLPYYLTNTSYFRNCHFITDDQLKNITSLTPGYFINMKGVKGIEISGCEFINNSPAEYSYNKRGFGIYSDNSQFNVQKFNTVKCRFENLYMGIKAINCQLQVISIMDAEFYNVDKGNFLFNLKTPIIIGNSISLYQNISSDASYGMVIWNCTGYRLENNIVQGLNTASIGFYVINSGTGYNKIYHNDFTNLKYGIQVNS